MVARRQGRRRAAARRVVPLVLAGPVAAGCTAAEDPRPPRPRLSVSISQPRPDEGTRTLRGAVVNNGSTTVEVAAVRLAWRGLPSDPVALDEEVAAGAIAGFTLEHGAARCDDGAAEPPSVALEVGGSETTVLLDVDDAATLRDPAAAPCRARRAPPRRPGVLGPAHRDPPLRRARGHQQLPDLPAHRLPRLDHGPEQRVIAFPEPGPRRALVRLLDRACRAPADR